MKHKAILASLITLFICLQISFAQVDLKTSNLPILKINTNGQGIDGDIKITASMQLIDNGVGVKNKITDAPNAYNGKIGIEYRGNTSLDLSDKKPYSIELRDDAGKSIDVPLLGMPAESDWVLLAPFSDKTLIRDVLAYKLEGKLNMWSPKTRFVELVMNGEYRGVYAVIEKVKRGKNRINVSKLKKTDEAGDSLTGGYIVSFDKYHPGEEPIFLEIEDKKKNGVTFLMPFKIVYPKAADITPKQKNYFRNWLIAFEKVLDGPNFKDTLNGYRKYIDVPSFIDMIIIQEITRNVDGYRLSTYFSKDKDSKGGKLVASPAWDFNIALGNANYCDGDKTFGWAMDFNDACPDDGFGVHFWWKRLMEDEAFSKQVATRWKTLRKGAFSPKNLEATIDTLTTELSEAQVRNFQQWQILSQWIWPNAYVGNSYNNEVNYLRDWLAARALWLDGEMSNLLADKFDPNKDFTPYLAPNPTSGQITMQSYLLKSTDIEVRLYDTQGRLMSSFFDKAPATAKHSFDLDISHYESGLYFYQIWLSGKLATTGKVVKQ